VAFKEGAFGFNSGHGDIWGMESGPLADRWVHVAAQFFNGDITQSRLFINGVEQAMSSWSEPPRSSAAITSAAIGGWRSSGHYRFSGSIDEVAVFNYALPAERITAQYQAGIDAVTQYPDVVLADGPIGYYRLNELSVDDPVTDSSGHGSHGTIFFTPEFGVPGALAGDADPAYDFNMAKVHLELSEINTADGGWNTVTFWMKWDGGTKPDLAIFYLAPTRARMRVLSGESGFQQWIDEGP
jgi:hypothetical protein